MYHKLATYYNQFFSFDDVGIRSFYQSIQKKDAYTLDLGSGTGRLTNLLHEVYHHSIGVDLDDQMIKIAQKNYPNIPFVKKDMITYLSMYPNTFDVITCYGNTIAHISSKDLKIFIDQAYKALKDDGYMCIQLLNYANILKEKIPHLPLLKYENMTLLRTYTYKNDHIVFKTIFIEDDKKTLLNKNILYPHVLDEITQLVKDRFDAAYYRSHDKKPYQADASHLLILLHKKSITN